MTSAAAVHLGPKKQEEERGVAYRLQLRDSGKTVPIGIRRYGGLYCHKCNVTLLEEGEEAARLANKKHRLACALCGATPDNSKGSTVRECQSFDWRIAPHRLEFDSVRNAAQVVDTYGTTFDVDRFLRKVVRDACPIQFYDKIEA